MYIQIEPALAEELKALCVKMKLNQKQCVKNALLSYIQDMHDYTDALNAQKESQNDSHMPILFEDLEKELGLDAQDA